MGGHGRARPALTLLCAVCAGWLSAAAQTRPDVQAIVARVGERVVDYYRRAQRLVCTDVYRVLPIGPDWSPIGMTRTVESELHVDLNLSDDGRTPEATDARKIISINGRAPRERDRKDRQTCTDPNPISPEPLDFLLASHREEYRFTSVKRGTDEGRPALVIDFASADRRSRLELHKKEGVKDACYEAVGPAEMTGRLWVDATTYDVLRVDQHLAGPTDVRVPRQLQREDGLEDPLVLDRDDLTLHYRPVPFQNPDETLVLPSSIDSTIVFRNGLQSTRRTDTFTGYRRFLTDGRLVRDER